MMPRTIFLARLLGLFFLLTGIAMLIRRDTMVATVMALLRDEPLLFALGMSALAVGLAMVLMHNVWSGGVLPVVVTLLGWTFVIRGAAASDEVVDSCSWSAHCALTSSITAMPASRWCSAPI